VDPGSIVTGWGLIGGEPARPVRLDGGVIRLGGEPADLPRRLSRLQQELTALVRRLRPTSAAVESPYLGANARSAFQLAQARGVALAVLAGAGLDVAEYTPATVKKAVTGNGRAPKEQVRSMVSHLLGGPAANAPFDVTDAMAVALCHACSRRHRALVERRPLGADGDRTPR
jgi:crossover junction endodeoxyribonuclease RuvC